MEDKLTFEERSMLLKLARRAIEAAIQGQPFPELDAGNLPARLLEPGVSFVTLTRSGELRGCIGALEPRVSLAEDVQEHAVAAAFQDYRFHPVQAEELPSIEIEISRLTPQSKLEYDHPDELLKLLRPGIDGVVIHYGMYRATFLPQVWEKLPAPEMFLNHLCQKMGAPGNLWRKEKLEVYTYQVEEFREQAHQPG
jgi:AmmeMemoRadiSam system protein A